jgi:hypothetical protein
MESSPGRSRRWAVLSAALVAVPIAILGLSASSASAARFDSSGTLTLQGAVSGTLHVLASVNGGAFPGCAIDESSGSGSTAKAIEAMTWLNAKLTVGKKSEIVPSVELSVDVPRFGRTYSIAPSATAAYALVSLNVGFNTYDQSSGSATTASKGVSGSLSGVLKGTPGVSGQVTIKGHWTGCAVPAS